MGDNIYCDVCDKELGEDVFELDIEKLIFGAREQVYHRRLCERCFKNVKGVTEIK